MGLCMKSIAYIMLVFCISVISFGQQKEPTSEGYPDSAHIDYGQIAERWVAAYNGTDANELAPLYSEDAQYISGHVAGLVADGRDRLIANFREGMNMGGHLDRLEILSITHSCDLATVLCKYDANNNGQKVSGRTLLILKKINNRWLITLHMTVI